ncbi:MAG: efflux RND transporter permease subunit [Spirochaetales bacterium]|nr:efflux RND transporter permease subunit [Spirochaetales bacterium]
MKKIIEYFAGKPLFTNFLMIVVFIGGVVFWHQTGKEEMPNITYDFVRVAASYAGASAQETEFFVTTKLEDAISGIQGIKDFESRTGPGTANLYIDLVPGYADRDETIQEIKDSVERLRLPEDVNDTLSVREFKSSNRSIVDVMLYYKNEQVMNEKSRSELQITGYILQERLQQLPAISEVSESSFLADKIDIYVIPSKLIEYEITLPEIINEIKKNNIRLPLGSLDDTDTTKVTFTAELTNLEDIRNVIIRSGFERRTLYLRDVAVVSRKMNEQDSIFKVNGREAIRLNVVKTSNAGIIEAVDEVRGAIAVFKDTVLKDTGMETVLMDDESKSVINRLNLIVSNGLFGFILLITLLFLFLNFRSGLWVAMGVPFCFAFTMIFASLMGHTVNNMTLSAVIIVMGMVVDDAIVVAENVTRLKNDGVPTMEAVVKGTAQVFVPIVASITTTCAAFLPLFFFQGRFAMLTSYLPPIIFLMLGGSLFEAVIILPSHLKHKIPRWLRVVFSLGTLPLIEKYFENKKKIKTGAKATVQKEKPKHRHWFFHIEDAYGKLLEKILPWKWLLAIVFVGLFVFSFFLFSNMKFVLFPNEETTDITMFGAAETGLDKYRTEVLVRQIEEILLPYLDREVVGFRAFISRGRRGSVREENRFSVNIELVPLEQRSKTSNQLISEWQEKLDSVTGFEELEFAKNRFGQSSGSAIDIIIQENDDDDRNAVAAMLLAEMQKVPALKNPEIEFIKTNPEINILVNRNISGALGISPETVSSTMKTILNGSKLFEIVEPDQNIEVLLSIHPDTKKNIGSVLEIPVLNSSRNLIPIRAITWSTRTTTPESINRWGSKRVLHVFGDLTEEIDLAAAAVDMPTQDEIQKLQEDARNGNPQARDRLAQLREAGLLKRPGTEQATDGTQAPAIEKVTTLPSIMTPLEIADYFEKNVFPKILKEYPRTLLSFGGEVRETRESGNELIIAIIFVIVLIYLILALSLKSLAQPFIIMLSIPFGFIGVVLALQVHGMAVYGFFAIVGALGLAGVVVNDSIVLLDKLINEYDNMDKKLSIVTRVAMITKTRLRAVVLTTVTTVAGLLPTAYGVFGYDSMLSEMMLTLAWGLIFGTCITLVIVPSMFCFIKEAGNWFKKAL